MLLLGWMFTGNEGSGQIQKLEAQELVAHRFFPGFSSDPDGGRCEVGHKLCHIWGMGTSKHRMAKLSEFLVIGFSWTITVILLGCMKTWLYVFEGHSM